MHKIFFILILLVLVTTSAFSQKTINKKSEPFSVNLKPVYTQGIAPDLITSVEFIDSNDNGILDINENASLKIKIRNNGKGIAQGLNFFFKSFPNQNYSIAPLNELPFIQAGEVIVLTTSITYTDTNNYTETGHIDLSIYEHFGHNPNPIKLDIKPNYKRGVPPNLFVELNFNDDNENGLIESEENAHLDITLINKGKGNAQGIEVSIIDNIEDPNFIIGTVKSIPFIAPNEKIKITVPIQAKFDVLTAKHKLEINVSEYFGYDMDPAVLNVNSLEYQKPEIVIAGYEIIDYGEGTTAIFEDGQLQAGEMAKIKLIVQNIGLGDANNISYVLHSADNNIYIENGNGNLKQLKSGKTAEVFTFISPNKRVNTKGNLPVFINITEDQGLGDLTDFNIPIQLNQKPNQTKIHEVKVDLDEFKNHIARFEYSSSKFTANIGVIHNIEDIKPSKNVRENSVAVVFGIENYTNLPPAPYANNDANIIEKYFKDRLGIKEVVVFKDGDANGFIFDNTFNSEYGELQKAIIKGETDLFVFYSGHGIPSKDGNNIYLFPFDGKVERVESQGYNINDLYENLNKLGAKSTTVFIDACFSGSSRTSENVKLENLVATKGIKVIPKIKNPWDTNPNFTVYNSSGPSETSLGFDPSKTGLFTYFMCAGLNGEADANNDRKITNGELSKYIIKNVSETSKKVFGLQTPQFHGKEDLILVEY